MRVFWLEKPASQAKMTTLSSLAGQPLFAGLRQRALQRLAAACAIAVGGPLATFTALAEAPLLPLANPCKGLAVCDGFESATAGGPPNAALWTVGGANCTGTGQASVDATAARSGKQSLKVTSTGGYCNHIFAATPVPFPAAKRFYGRFYVRFAEALGDGHVTFMAMKDTADNQRDLRMGGQNRILMWNRESDDATLPVLSPQGIALSVVPAAGAWHCVEFSVNGNRGGLKTWFNGAPVTGLQVDTTPTPEVDSQWLARGPWHPALADFRLGWESYAGQPMTLWFDDVALDQERIRCGAN